MENPFVGNIMYSYSYMLWKSSKEKKDLL